MSALVSCQWLADRLGSPEIVLLDATLPPVGVVPKVDTHALYLEQHLPGAVFFDIDTLSDHTSGLPHTLPSAESFAAAMAKLGVPSNATLVVYEQGNVFSAPRARWMLQTMGAADVYLLDGGLQAWIGDGLPTESGEVQREPAIFDAVLDAAAVTTYAELQEKLATPSQVLDARSAGRFSGTAPEPRPGLSSGHMPGSINTPYTDLADGQRMKSVAALQEVFGERGVDLYSPITATCGSGVTAAVVLLAAELAGATGLSLYDGSWAEYAQEPNAVIEKS